MTQLTKKYTEKAKLVEKKEYPLDEAVDLLTRLSTTSFDATAEVHINVLSDPKKGEQQVRTTVTLPHGTGKKLRIAAVVPEDMAKDVLSAGAVLAGETSVIDDITKGKIDFDVLVAVPTLMKSLGSVAKVLGQQGLMPNPKSGTVTDDPVRTIQELQKGRIELRTDKQAIVHAAFGKLSFGKDKLSDNLRTLLSALKEAKPSGIKGEFIKSIALVPSMGPSVRVDIGSLVNA